MQERTEELCRREQQRQEVGEAAERSFWAAATSRVEKRRECTEFTWVKFYQMIKTKSKKSDVA